MVGFRRGDRLYEWVRRTVERRLPMLYRIIINYRSPTSRGHRLAAVRRTVAFDIRTRLLRRPTVARIGTHSKLIAYPGETNSPHTAYRNPPNWPEMGVWQQHLKPGDLFVDVGANIGIYTLLALDLGAQVIAFEPDPRNAARLREHLALNGYEAEVIEKAVSNVAGEITFTIGLDSYNHLVLGEADDVPTRTVPTVTLDEVIGDRHVTGMKIDVEGAERLVLEGAARALREHRIAMVQLEWTERDPKRTLGETRDPVAAVLRDAGYGLYRPERETARLQPVADTQPGRDIFARPNAP